MALAINEPLNAEVQYEAACVHDSLGLESAAVPYYLAALAGTLPAEKRRGAYLGLGSTYRTIGRYEEALSTLQAGLAQFPGAREFNVFLSMVEYNLGRHKAAVEALLVLLAETSTDEGIRTYSGAISFYAQDIERSWVDDA